MKSGANPGVTTAPSPAPRQASAARRMPADFALAIAAAAVGIAATIWACGGPDMLTGRPLKFKGDAVFHYTLAKTAIDDPWTWHAGRLGAPYGSSLAAFGVVLPVETVLLKVVSLTTHDAVSLLNRTWVLLVGLAATNAYAAARMLGLPRIAAFACGCLFAAAPSVCLRNVTHFNLHPAFVPIPVALATLVVSGGIQRLGPATFVAGCIASVAAGLGYVYWPFFHAILFVAALALAALTGRREALPRGAVCLSAIVAAASLNLAPTLASWAQEGRPATLDYKQPEEADVFALKIRDMIMPASTSLIPALAAVGRHIEQVGWPLPSESSHAKLGLVAAVGFLLSLAVLAGCRPPVDEGLTSVVRAAASLVLVLVTVAMTGGFGSLFNAFVAPQFRCYNRVSIMIGFLGLVGSTACISRLLSRTGWRPWPCRLVWAALLACGIVEQNSGATIRARSDETQRQRHAVESFVRTTEAKLPPDAAIMMLPITPFPLDPGRGRMLNFDHAKPYLFSSRLRWSWPTFGPRHEQLAVALGGPDEAGFVSRIRGSGFDFIWVDRAAPADEIAPLETAITTAGGRLLLEDPAGRYRVYAIGDVAPAPIETPS